MNADELHVRAVRARDLEQLAGFRCSTGEPWEDLVETQIRGPLPRRYLAATPRWDGRMLVVHDEAGALLAVGAHHIEPTLVPDIGYTEVIAVALDARGTLVELPGGREISLGEFLLLRRAGPALGRAAVALARGGAPPRGRSYSTASAREACASSASIGTTSRARACVAPSTTAAAQPAW